MYDISRRMFLTAGGATAAMAALGIAGCGSGGATGGSGSAAAAGSAGSAAATASYDYTYDGIEEWDEPIPTADGKTTLHDVMDSMALPGTDMEAFAHSELGEFAVSSSYLNNHIGKIDAPEVEEYWAERGMVHEVHDLDDADRQWTSLVPDDYDASKSYPLLFVWHGTGNPVLLAEGYGYGEVAKEKGWICVFPWAANDDLYISEFDRILDYMTEHYTIDTDRIYTSGFSKGGLMSQLLALQRGSVLAAAAPCGMPAGGAPTERLRSDDFTNAQAGIPVLFFGGEYDGVTGPVPYDEDYKLRGVNGFLAVNGIADSGQTLEKSQELAEGADDPAEKLIGLKFDNTEELEADGTVYRTGSFFNGDDTAVVQFVGCEKAIHWPTPSMAQIAMDFMEQFTKADSVSMEDVDMSDFLLNFSK